MKLRKMILSCVAGLTLAGALSTTGVRAEEATIDDNTLVISTEKQNPTGNNFEYIWWNRGELYQVLTFRNLFVANADLNEFEPDLAASYEVSEDGLTYTFLMKDGVKWSDGEDLTAEDVEFSIKAALRAGQISSIYTAVFNNIEGASEYSDGTKDDLAGLAVEDNSITITLTQPASTMISMMSQFAILPEHALADQDPLTLHQSEFWAAPITSGMYAVEEVSTDNYISLVANEYYDLEAPQIERVVVRQLDDELTAALAGETAYTYSRSSSSADQIEAEEGWSVYPVDSLYYRYLIFNITDAEGNVNEQMNDPRVREALLLGVDRQAIVSELIGETARLADSGVPQDDTVNYNENNNTYEYDPERAKALLDEAGFDYSQAVTILTGGGQIDMANAMAAYLSQIGVNAEVREMQADGATELFDLRDYDIAFKGLAAFSYEEWYNEYTSNNFQAILGDAEAFVDPLAALNASIDDASRAEALKNLQTVEQENIYKYPLAFENYFIFVDESKVDIGDTEFGNPKYAYDTGFENWTIK